MLSNIVMAILICLFCYLKRVVYLYKFIDNKGKFEETSLPSIECFCSNLNFQNIIKSDYKHAKNVSNAFKMKNLGDYHKLCVQKDVLLFCDVFKNFCEMCLNAYGLNPTDFYSEPGSQWATALKKSKLDLLKDIGALLIKELGFYCHKVL